MSPRGERLLAAILADLLVRDKWKAWQYVDNAVTVAKSADEEVARRETP